MTDKQRLKELTEKYLPYDEQKVHAQTKTQDIKLNLNEQAYHVGIDEHAEPLITPSPNDLADIYGILTYDDHPTYISTHRTGAHIAYQVAPDFQDDLVPDDTMIDETNREPLLSPSQVYNALAALQPAKAKEATTNNLTTVYFGGEPRRRGWRRPYKVTATYTDLKTVNDFTTYKTITKAFAKPHGDTPHNPPTRT